MRTKTEPSLKSTLRNTGYSEKTADKIVNWYLFPEKSKVVQFKH